MQFPEFPDIDFSGATFCSDARTATVRSQQEAAFQVMVAFLQLLEVWSLTTEHTPWSVSINFHGRARRLDIATLTPDGQHLESYVMGIDMNIVDLDTFGTAVSLPASGPTQ